MQKPSFDEWVIQSAAVIHSLRLIEAVYADHKDSAKAQRVFQLRSQLGSAFAELLASGALVTATQAQQVETAIKNGLDAFGAILAAMQFFSSDMQQLLQSSWAGECNGRRATDIFKGKPGQQNGGIGSGLPEDGGLPEAMNAIIEAEKYGKTPRLSMGKGRSDQQLEIYIRELAGLPPISSGGNVARSSGIGHYG